MDWCTASIARPGRDGWAAPPFLPPSGSANRGSEYALNHLLASFCLQGAAHRLQSSAKEPGRAGRALGPEA